MPAWVNQGVQTYTKRLPRHIELEFRELPVAQRASGSTPQKLKQKEGENLLKAVPDSAYVIALDEHGKSWDSTGVAAQLEYWMANYPNIVFLIGGPDGLAESCKQQADELWSLSPLTLPHPLVRVVLAEQIYRAWTLVQGHPYHRD
jgi:23S rRNA (pseudouridine1915-N3)-methyltransferase